MRVCPHDDTQLRQLENQTLDAAVDEGASQQSSRGASTQLRAQVWVCSRCGYVGTFVDLAQFPELFPD